MKLMKKLLSIVILPCMLFSLLLSGCSTDELQSVKREKVSGIADLIFSDDGLVPNGELTWNMGTEEFLKRVYGAETMIPGEESFDEQRYFYSEEQNVSTYNPPVVYRVKGMEADAEVIYAFDESGLYMAGYSWTFDKEDQEKAEKCIELLADELNSDPHIVPTAVEQPDLSQLERALQYSKWSVADAKEQSVELSVLSHLNTISVTLTIKA